METEQRIDEPLIGRWRVGQHPQYGFWCVIRENYGGGFSSKSAKTKEGAEAMYREMAAKGTCLECGDVLDDSYMEPYKTRIHETRHCMTCLFWDDYVGKINNPASVRVGVSHYWIAPDKPLNYGGFVGHGGAEFVIRFSDGREIVSRNLWAQGIIPPHYRDRLPANAEFATRGRRAVGNSRHQGGYVGSGSADSSVQP